MGNSQGKFHKSQIRVRAGIQRRQERFLRVDFKWHIGFCIGAKSLISQQTGLFIDVLCFGLNTVLDKNKHKDIIGEILDLRKTFQQDYGEDLAEFIEFYDPNIYLYNSSVAENILLSSPWWLDRLSWTTYSKASAQLMGNMAGLFPRCIPRHSYHEAHQTIT